MKHIPFIVLLCGLCAATVAAQNAGSLVVGRSGMVVSASEEATRAGIAVLNSGGNAVDAAVAVCFTLAVTYPSAGNIGGGSYILLRMEDGRSTAIDARETAPGAARRGMYLDAQGKVLPEASLYGPRAAGVPGSVDGLLVALERYGSLPRDAVMKRAIQLAKKGFPIHARLARQFAMQREQFQRYPSTEKIFAAKKRWRARDRWKQPELAATLERIRRDGRDGFYAGETALRIEEAMRRDGGVITAKDLQSYHCVERRPLRGRWREYDILGMPPSSSGGVALLQMLGVLECLKPGEHPSVSASSAHAMIEAMRRAFADRAAFLGDPDYVRVPVDSLLSPATIAALCASVQPERATPSGLLHKELQPPREGDHTTHIVVLDGKGNAVSITTTLNSSYGSMYVVPGTGILLNNEMDDFAVKPGSPNQFGLLGSEANSIVPGKRMLSSMTPTIVMCNGSPVLLTGSPGGSRIITSVLQTVLNVLQHGMRLDSAIAMPRIHHQWYPEHVEYEQGALREDVLEQLRARGHIVRECAEFGRVEGIYFDAASGIMQGCSDRRGYGHAQAVGGVGTTIRRKK